MVMVVRYVRNRCLLKYYDFSNDEVFEASFILIVLGTIYGIRTSKNLRISKQYDYIFV